MIQLIRKPLHKCTPKGSLDIEGSGGHKIRDLWNILELESTSFANGLSVEFVRGREHSRITSRFAAWGIVRMVVPFIGWENWEEQVGRWEVKSYGLVMLS